MIALAENACHARAFDALDEAGQMLRALPGYEAVANFYLGQAALRLGTGNIERARTLFEQTAGRAPIIYQSRAILYLGSIAEYKSDYQAELECYRDALNLKHDAFTFIEANRAIAIAASREGNHKAALHHLELIRPVVEAARIPRLYFDWHNSIAVELGEIGRIDEAFNHSNIATRSSFALICPEYSETKAELEAKQDSNCHSMTVAARSASDQCELQQKASGHCSQMGIAHCDLIPKPAIIEQAASLACIVARIIEANPPTGPPFN